MPMIETTTIRFAPAAAPARWTFRAEAVKNAVASSWSGEGPVAAFTFRGYKDGVVYLAMKGSCSGCPSSTATLKHGIQNLLRHFVPDVTEVRPI